MERKEMKGIKIKKRNDGKRIQNKEKQCIIIE